jgi:hypothetical protein
LKPKHDRFLQVTLHPRLLNINAHRRRSKTAEKIYTVKTDTPDIAVKVEREDTGYLAMYVHHYFQAND